MIRTFGLALAAVVALAATPALAQGYGSSPAMPANNNSVQQPDRDKGGAVAPKIDTKIDPKNHDQGTKEAAAAVAAAGIACDVSDAYFISEGDVPDAAGKKVKSKIYEIACKNNLGQIVINPSVPGTPSKHYDCISIMASPSLRCRLPGNSDPKAVIAPIVASTGQACTVSDVRAIGSNPAGDSFFEVACGGEPGFIVKKGADNKNVAEDCVKVLGSNLECKLTTPAQLKDHETRTVGKLIAASGHACEPKATRTIGALTSGNIAYEVACNDGSGYMLLSTAQGAFYQAAPCAKADTIANGCTLTNAVDAQIKEASTYTRLARASGFPCQVSKYHYIGTDQATQSEVVELACSDRPDGGIAVLPADNSPGHVYDCVRAGALGQTCKLTDATLVYTRYTEALAAKGKTTCKVSNAHWIGHFPADNTDLIETACSDGLSGWVTVMNPSNKVVDVLSCGQAKASGVECTLPGNRK